MPLAEATTLIKPVYHLVDPAPEPTTIVDLFPPRSWHFDCEADEYQVPSPHTESTMVAASSHDITPIHNYFDAIFDDAGEIRDIAINARRDDSVVVALAPIGTFTTPAKSSTVILPRFLPAVTQEIPASVRFDWAGTPAESGAHTAADAAVISTDDKTETSPVNRPALLVSRDMFYHSNAPSLRVPGLLEDVTVYGADAVLWSNDPHVVYTVIPPVTGVFECAFPACPCPPDVIPLASRGRGAIDGHTPPLLEGRRRCVRTPSFLSFLPNMASMCCYLRSRTVAWWTMIGQGNVLPLRVVFPGAPLPAQVSYLASVVVLYLIASKLPPWLSVVVVGVSVLGLGESSRIIKARVSPSSQRYSGLLVFSLRLPTCESTQLVVLHRPEGASSSSGRSVAGCSSYLVLSSCYFP